MAKAVSVCHRDLEENKAGYAMGVWKGPFPLSGRVAPSPWDSIEKNLRWIKELQGYIGRTAGTFQQHKKALLPPEGSGLSQPGTHRRGSEGERAETSTGSREFPSCLAMAHVLARENRRKTLEERTWQEQEPFHFNSRIE